MQEIYKSFKMRISKTKKCNWCNKRKVIEDMYNLSLISEKKETWICSDCNIKEDIV